MGDFVKGGMIGIQWKSSISSLYKKINMYYMINYELIIFYLIVIKRKEYEDSLMLEERIHIFFTKTSKNE